MEGSWVTPFSFDGVCVANPVTLSNTDTASNVSLVLAIPMLSTLPALKRRASVSCFVSFSVIDPGRMGPITTSCDRLTGVGARLDTVNRITEDKFVLGICTNGVHNVDMDVRTIDNASLPSSFK